MQAAESDGEKMTFTASQKNAIIYRKGSVLVSAGAGSGKTRVITERLMEYIDPNMTEAEPKDIDRFLIITFTRAAAAELRARIAGAIAERLYANPGNMHLRRQMMLVRNAQIETIHSFCGSILREFAVQLSLSPAFRILEDEKKERMLASALERVLERSYERGEEDFFKLADSVGAGRDDSRLAELTIKLYNSMQSHADPSRWIAAQTEELQFSPADIGETVWGRELLSEISEEVSFWADEMGRALTEMQEEPVVRTAYEESFLVTVRDLRKLEAALKVSWDEAYTCLPVRFPTIRPVRVPDAQPFAERMKDRRQLCKDEMKKLNERVLTGRSAQLLADQRETAPEMQGLLRLCSDLDAEYWKSKQRGNYLDFSDLEHLALQLLYDENGEQTATAKQIAERFEEIMVDEYQDVSRVQDSIFRAVSRDGGNLFFVGDIKQSIYRFRLADPGIFTEKSRSFGDPMNSRGECLIHLQENFRSRKPILDAVNEVFGRCMSEQLGELNYNENEKLRPGNVCLEETKLPEVILLKRDPSVGSALEEEAEVVGQEIRDLIGEGRIQGEKGSHRICFGDIAILLRSANTDGGVFRRKLMQMGIPVASGGGSDFFSSVEISTVFAMLQLIDNPHRDIPLLTVLKSPAFGFTPDQLSLIRAVSPNTDYYSALRSSKDEMAEGFLMKLEMLRAEAPDLDPVQIIERIIEELDLWSICGAMTDGEQRMQRLQDFIEMGNAFLRTDERGLHRLIQWLDNLKKNERAPANSSGGADAVHILSIHKSKGLEFPVVFYSALGKQFNMRDTMEPVLIHPVLGLGPKRTDSVRKIEYPTLARQAIARKIGRELRSEEMRLMYVAMTRAKERLIMTACINKPEEQIEKARKLLEYEKIPALLLQNTSNPLPWILPSAVKGETLRCRVQTLEAKSCEETTADDKRSTDVDPETAELLEHRLGFCYPFATAEELPSKLTATGLEKGRVRDEDAVDIIRFRQKNFEFNPKPIESTELKAAELGTAIHLVLQHLPLDSVLTSEDIEQEIGKLVQKKYLSSGTAELVDREIILRFLESDLGLRIRKAEKKWREFRFSLLCSAKDLIPEETAEDKILLQGVVDCCFMEDDELVIVDYKSDRVSKENVQERAEHYRRQLNAYAEALTRIMGIPVKEQVLFFLEPGVAVSL